jgi:hypothetical protein
VVDRQRAHIDLLPVRRPGNGRVIGRVSRLADRDDQAPLQRVAVDGRNQRIEQVILLRLSGVGRADWLERLDRYHRPSNRSHRASGIDETKSRRTYN